MTFTIAIGGTSGSGKTSLARAVSEALDAAPALHFDDYEYPDPSSAYPDFEGWIARGLPVASHGAETLAGEIAKLRAGADIREPKTDRTISPRPFLVVEEPLGRARPAIAPLIDFAVIVATPSEIALARRVKRDLAGAPGDQDLTAVVVRVQSYLAWYVAGGHAFYDRVVGLAQASADLIVDGMLPVQENANLVADRARALSAAR
jgi:uridine kinase